MKLVDEVRIKAGGPGSGRPAGWGKNKDQDMLTALKVHNYTQDKSYAGNPTPIYRHPLGANVQLNTARNTTSHAWYHSPGSFKYATSGWGPDSLFDHLSNLREHK